jgi:hypothetical protein
MGHTCRWQRYSLRCHHSNIGKSYWSKVPAHQQQFCQCQLTGSLQLEEDVKLLHYHVQELYLEEEESWESQSFVLAFWEISLDNATNRTSADGNEMAMMPRN